MSGYVTRADMEAAGERIAARDGITLDELRDRVRNPQRGCERTACTETFTPTDDRQKYCADSCRAKAHRERNGGA